jgi:hypothetical protein
MAISYADKFFEQSGGLVPQEVLGASDVPLGSILQYRNGTWVHLNTVLEKFGLDPKPLPAPPAIVKNNYFGSGGDEFAFKTYAAGKAGKLITNVADAAARAEVTFGSSGAFMFAVQDQTVRMLGNLEQLFGMIRFAYHIGKWEKDWAVVIGVASAKSFAADRGRSKNAAMVITGRGKVGPPDSVGEVSARMSFKYAESEVAHTAQAPANGFALQLVKIDPKWYRRWDKEIIDAAHVRDALLGSAKALRVTGADTATRLYGIPPWDGKLPTDGFVIANRRYAGSRALPASVRTLGVKKPAAKKASKKRVTATTAPARRR